MDKKRDYWVDNVKVVACILVVLGHFFQSMVKAGIIADNFFTSGSILLSIISMYRFSLFVLATCIKNIAEWIV